jgi:hypothetical protein
VIDEERKQILVAGIWLGDVTLALASFAGELPAYVQGIDWAQQVPTDEDAAAIKAKADEVLAARPDKAGLPEELIRMVLGNALAKERFLSAIRCLEMLGERDEVVDSHISRVPKLLAGGKSQEAARALVVAANLDLDEGIPLFQILGPVLHDHCTGAPEACVTRLGGDDAVLKGLEYLIASSKVFEGMSQLSPEARRTLLPLIAAERDPNAIRFYDTYRTAHLDLEDVRTGMVAELATELTTVRNTLAALGETLKGLEPGPEARDDLQKLARTAASLSRDFEDAGQLLENWQFRRLADRLERFSETRHELSDLRERLTGAFEPGAAAVSPILELIDRLDQTGREGIVRALEKSKLFLTSKGGFAEAVRKMIDDLADEVGKGAGADVESFKDDLTKAKEREGEKDASAIALVDQLAELVETVSEKGTAAGYVKAVENLVALAPVRMLGRQVHTREHWQFLRELAFKYPVAPLMCCLRQVNDRWMVVPSWDSDLAVLLRSYFERSAAA